MYLLNMLRYICIASTFLIVTQGLVSVEDVHHECYRNCSSSLDPLVCNYNFDVEWYYSMSKECGDCPVNLGDCNQYSCIPINGVRRPIITVNRRFPGPSIHVCENDIINVTVNNNMLNGEAISIHWHGILQTDSPYMDGTSFITQCPIGPSHSFTYTFKAENVGTHFWHAHTGLQRQDGFVGSLVVRQPKERDLQRDMYDVDIMEHYVLVMDWLDNVALDRFLRLEHDKGPDSPDSIVVNGKGKRKIFTRDDDTREYYTEREVFKVQYGMRYRFRIASNVGTNCAIRISVDSHTLSMIASDGQPFEPVEVDTFIINAGERFDFILSSTQDIGNYWMRFKGLNGCSDQQELGIVRYEGSQEVNPVADESLSREGFELNPLPGMEPPSYMSIDKVRSLENDTSTLDPNAVVSTYYVAMDFNAVIKDNSRTPQFNHVSFLQPTGTLLTQHQDMDASQFCDAKEVLNMTDKCSKEFCECIHVINADVGEIVELVLIDESKLFAAFHPLHLHGHSYRVLALKKLGKSTTIGEVMAMDQAGQITRNLEAAPLKDTVMIPSGGYTIVRFEANNPGWWYFHCHIEFHVQVGMGMVFHVGGDEDLPEVPPDFPTCYNWPSMASKKPSRSTFIHSSEVVVFLSSLFSFVLLNNITG